MRKTNVLLALVLVCLMLILVRQGIDANRSQDLVTAERAVIFTPQVIEIQVNGVDMLCVWAYFHGFGLSCDWPQDNVYPVPLPATPVPTSTPNPY